ncbi:MAG: SPOR domain-containing protein [Candidatus Zixiibacteriota bacterium]|nr:MAG: SPOR domain-containing protein [candidate division Zixibacteria bacterium]
MKAIIATLLLALTISGGSFAQSPHLTGEKEIPRDDFPALVEGWRVQVGAYSSQETAEHLKEILKSATGRKVHLQGEAGIWRVRVGEFADSASAADFLRGTLAPQGYHDARVVRDRLPVDRESLPPPPTVPGYRLQAYALSSRDSALARARDLAVNVPEAAVHVIQAGDLYKIQIGDFRTRAGADSLNAQITGRADLQPLVVETRIPVDPPPPQPLSYPRDIFRYFED